MGGDLNLKKSWHPALMSNQKRVWEEEHKALEERKRIELMQRERAEERKIQELQAMEEAAGGKKRLNRVDWMYSGPAAGQVGTTEEMEGYLLGKRRIDPLLKTSEETEKLQKGAGQDSFMAVQPNANTARDVASKIRDDPMLAIKKKEQASLDAVMKDPMQRRLFLKEQAKREKKEAKRRRREEEDEDDRRSRRRRHDDRDRERERHRHHHRSHRRRSDSYDRSKSRSPRRYRDDYDRSRSRSPRRHHDDYNKSHSRREKESHYRRRSPSRERFPRRDNNRPRRSSDTERRSTNGSHPPRGSKSAVDLRAEKLAAMQSNATTLDSERKRRVEEAQEQDARERERDDRMRSEKGRFVAGLHRKAGDMDLGEALHRGRAGVTAE